MADAVDLKSNVERREGSNPSAGTFFRLDLAMDAKICDICGTTYLAPITHRERVKDLEIKRTKFGWIKNSSTESQNLTWKKTYKLTFTKEVSIVCENETYYTTTTFNICPRCSDKICKFIDTLDEGNDGDHPVDSSDISTTDSVSNC